MVYFVRMGPVAAQKMIKVEYKDALTAEEQNSMFESLEQILYIVSLMATFDSPMTDVSSRIARANIQVVFVKGEWYSNGKERSKGSDISAYSIV